MSMSMPGWALGLGVLNEAPKVAGNWVNLFKGVQELRDQSNTNDALKQLEDFKTSQASDAFRPQGYISPENYAKLQQLRSDRTRQLLASEAAPDLGRIASLRDDPRFQDAASLAEIQKDPVQAVFGQNIPSMSGVIPGGKGEAPTAATGVNPYTAQALQGYTDNIGNVLDQFRGRTTRDPMALSRIGAEPKQAEGFKNASIGDENIFKTDQLVAAQVAKNGLNKIIAEYPLTRNVDSWNGLVNKLRSIPGIEPSLVDSTLKDMASRNQAPVGAPLTQFIKNGPNSTNSSVSVDMFGEPVANTRIVSSNNPSDRELGLIPSTSNETLDVSWIGPDGTPQSATVPRSELSTLKSSLKAQGIKELSTVDGKRASRTETLIKPEKGKRSLLGGRPGGASPAAAPSTVGGFTYVNGKLVQN